MKIKCLHGYFIMNEIEVGQASHFNNFYGLDLAPVDDYYTFKFLAEAPDYSLENLAFLGFKATTTHAGKPWEVFKANGCVFDFTTKTLKKLTTISVITDIYQSGPYLISNGLIMPGSKDTKGNIIESYTAWYNTELATWKYSEVIYA